MSDGGVHDGVNDGVCRLSSLIHPFTELKQINPTAENEKELLISLSRIIRQIRRSIDNCEDIDEHEQQLCRCSCFAEPGCLVNIVSVLISLLNVDDKYTRHLVSNIFLVVSEFLLANGEHWDEFIRLLCVSFEFGLCSILQPSFNGVEKLKSMPANLRLILNDFTWDGVSGIIHVLRGILKHLKGEEDMELMAIILDSLSNSLSEVPWDVLNGIQNDRCTDVKASSSDGNTVVKVLLVGNLVQLLCSLVGLMNSAEAEIGSLNKNAILHKICDFVPKILRWCLAKEQSCIHGRILAYFQHKFLMLMIRLSFHQQLDCSVILIWLQLLHGYFQDLLSRPLSVAQSDQDDSLEDSPFLFSLYDQEACHLSSRHLQRQAVFLLVRCCLSLIGPRCTSDVTDTGKRTSSLVHCDSGTIDDNLVRKKGLLEFYGWLQGKVPLDTFSEKQIYLEKCIKFTSSFITLYMHEDDILFEVLLQMLSVSFCPERMPSRDRRSCDTEEDILFHISNLFNPLLVLLEFLAELQYDHQLLLDYLISKDTGSKCAEYLLRSLRTICDSWNLFLQPLVGQTRVCQSNCQKSCKRTRTFLEDSCAEKEATPLWYGLPWSLEQYEKEHQSESKVFKSIRIQDGKACLIALSCALKNLHKKKLFPYNPEALIRRIARFEDLCDQKV